MITSLTRNRFFRNLFVCFFAVVFCSGGLRAGVELAIAPNGSDENVGSIKSPFQTLARASEEIRRLKVDGLDSDITVYLRGGVYRLTEPLILGPQDAAPDGRTITYRNFPGEDATISSGVNVSGWKKFTGHLTGLPEESRDKLWVAELPLEFDRFYTLYDGTVRLPRARTNGFVPTTDVHPRYNRDPSLDHYTLHYPEGALKNWSNLEDVELIILPSWPWTMNILPIASVDEDQCIARTAVPGTYQLSGMPPYSLGKSGFEQTAWIENVPEGLDSPGEWILDTKTRKVYLWPEGDQPSDDIYAPALRELIRVEGINDPVGDNDQPVRGIHFEGLTFTLADRGVWEEGDRGIQHDWEMMDKDNAMLRFRAAKDCSVERCRFIHASGNGIRMDLYAQNIRVQDCLFTRLGQSAVMMIGYGPGTKDVNKNHEILNNHIHHCGEIYWHSQMITAWQSGNNRIAHNYLHHIPRKAICISGVRAHWLRKDPKIRQCAITIRREEVGDAETYEDLVPFLHARNNIVEYNEVHDALQMLGDGAAINLSGGSDGNVVRNNYVHDCMALNPSAAIRMDGNQRGTLVENNVIVNMSVSGVIPKGENLIKNNFIINTCIRKKKYGIIRGLGRAEGLSSIEHNIIYSMNDERSFYGYDQLEKYDLTKTSASINHNLYFHPLFDESRWKELSRMKALGFDHDSQYADPLFRNWKEGDFTLLPDSPALKMGTKQIDLSTVGLLKSYPVKWRTPR